MFCCTTKLLYDYLFFVKLRKSRVGDYIKKNKTKQMLGYSDTTKNTLYLTIYSKVDLRAVIRMEDWV